MTKTILPVACDMSFTSLQEAARRLPAAKVYRLRVHSDRVFEARTLLRKLGCTTEDSPFAPYVNIELSDDILGHGWELWSADDCVYSPSW